MYKAIFLDFYGTVVEEDDALIAIISEHIQCTATVLTSKKAIADYWWGSFSGKFKSAYGDQFKLQRELELESLCDTIDHFQSTANPYELSERLFEHWRKPELFADSKGFLDRITTPIYVLSNIDRYDIEQAIEYNGLDFKQVMTSEDVRSYKPRAEMFEQALQAFGLQPHEVLHIGDSLTSDIVGANAMGIPVAWVNRQGREAPDWARPDYTVTQLTELLPLLSTR